MSTSKTPRLAMSLIDSDGEVIQDLGSYADGPVGRSDAAKVVSEEAHYLSVQREYGDERMREALAGMDLRIERVFADGRQELMRVPCREDARPQTLAEATVQQFLRVDALSRGEHLQTKPLTVTEQGAQIHADKVWEAQIRAQQAAAVAQQVEQMAPEAAQPIAETPTVKQEIKMGSFKIPLRREPTAILTPVRGQSKGLSI